MTVFGSTCILDKDRCQDDKELFREPAKCRRVLDTVLYLLLYNEEKNFYELT